MGRSYYRQRDNVGKKDNFLYFHGQRWWVSSVLGQKAGFLRSSLTTGDMLVPPLTGWQYLGARPGLAGGGHQSGAGVGGPGALQAGGGQ